MSEGSLYVVAFPEIALHDRDWIEEVRCANDPNAGKIAAHFTLAFALTDLTVAHVRNHLLTFAARERPIQFMCCQVTVGQDHASPIRYVFLVPEEGFSAINGLRDRLHTGPLEGQLSPEIPFVPHITLASGADSDAIQDQCRAINETLSPISGELRALTLICAQEDAITEIETFRLNAL